MSDEVVQTPFGSFLVNPQDGIGSTLKAGTLWDGPGFLQPIAIEYGSLGTPGVTILDVGANIGSFAVWLAHRAAWRVIAVEPVPETMLYLKANLDLNQRICADRVIPLEVAAYNRRTTLGIPTYDPNNMGATALQRYPPVGIREVDACPLDAYLWLYGDRVSLIKIDAQGCDGPAIQGLRQTIERDHPAIVFEWERDLAEQHGWCLEAAIELLVCWGYEVYEWPSQPNNYLARVPR